MLIRTQNKEELIEITSLTMSVIKPHSSPHSSKESKCYIEARQYGNAIILGVYSTKEKALNVLDMLQEEYLSPIVRNVVRENEVEIYQNKIFTMPKDNEV